MTKKQQDELHLFDEFRRLAPNLGLSEGVPKEPPAADVLSSIGTNTIGIEVTRILRQDEKRRESEESRVVEAARRQYESLGLPATGVGMSWVQKDPNPQDRDLLAKSLAEFVAQRLPSRGSWVVFDADSLPKILSDRLHYIRIERFVDYPKNYWCISRAGWVASLDPVQVQLEIAAKDPKVTGYRQTCDEAWLLIALEGDPSSWCRLSEEARTHRYVTKFKRVFLLGTTPRDITEFVVTAG
ncbi:MAG: hypothetical protein JSR82_09110 [Verrucomicrobia bacterium]|nr:hypothetical protein [Verrucomicrobiota bacterium]